MEANGSIPSSDTVNTTMENVPSIDDWLKIYIPVRAFCLLLSFWGIIGNAMLIYLLSCKIEKTRFIMYVLNITIADFFKIFNHIIYHVTFFKPTGSLPFLSFLRYLAHLFGNDASIYFLTAIVVERYLMVYIPVWYQSHQSEGFTALMCVILWTLSLVEMLLEYFSCHPKYFVTAYFKCEHIKTIHFIINCVQFIFIFLIFILAFLIRIESLTPRNFPTRLDISIVAVVVRLFIFEVPIRIAEVFYLWTSYNPELFVVSLLFDIICSSVCPYVYLFVGWWKSQKMQRSLHVFIERALTDEEENTITTTQEDQEQA